MPNRAKPPLLIQFAKWPEKGRVKTRLAEALGEAGALEAHIELTLAVLRNLAATGWRLAFHWDRPLEQPPAEARAILSELEARGIAQGLQRGTDLGERMSRALARGIEEQGGAIIVGSDCPSVDTAYLEQARAALEAFDVVLGPSDDGGYVLIGARRTVPDMLHGVDWGTDRALEQTLAQIQSRGLSVHQLEARWDVDEPEDWARFQRRR